MRAFFITLLVGCIALVACQKQERNVAHIGERYVLLMHKIGQEQTLAHEKEVEELLAPHCTKIVNGAVWYKTRAEFLPQLLATGQKIGAWTIEPLAVIPGQDKRTVVVYFLVRSQQAEVWNTMVILRCNEDLQITEIEEVFNSYDTMKR